MKVVDVEKSSVELEQLVAEIEAGEEIVIQRNGKAVARLTGAINREPGFLRKYEQWKNFVYDPSVFAPLMTDEDVRAEGFDI